MSNARYRLQGMELDFVSLVPAGDNPGARVVISKAASADPDHEQENQMAEISKADLPAEVVEYIETLETAYEAAEKENDEFRDKVTKAEARVTELEGVLAKSAPKDEAAAEEIQKSLLAKADPAVRELIEKQNAEIKHWQEITKAAEEARKEQVFIAKAAEVPYVGEDRKDLAGLLRRIADAMTPEDAAQVEKILKTANAQIEQGDLFKTLGRQFDSTTTSAVKAKADELRKADPNLTVEQAEAKVYEANPELALRAMEEEH